MTLMDQTPRLGGRRKTSVGVATAPQGVLDNHLSGRVAVIEWKRDIRANRLERHEGDQERDNCPPSAEAG